MLLVVKCLQDCRAVKIWSIGSSVGNASELQFLQMLYPFCFEANMLGIDSAMQPMKIGSGMEPYYN